MVTTSTCPGVRGGCENVDVSGARKKVVAVARKQVEVVPENTCLKRTTVLLDVGRHPRPFPTATSKHSPERHVRNLVGRGRGRGPLCHDNQREKGRHGFKVPLVERMDSVEKTADFPTWYYSMSITRASVPFKENSSQGDKPSGPFLVHRAGMLSRVQAASRAGGRGRGSGGILSTRREPHRYAARCAGTYIRPILATSTRDGAGTNGLENQAGSAPPSS